MSTCQTSQMQITQYWGGSVIACTAIGKLMQCGRVGLGLPLHVRGLSVRLMFVDQYAVHAARRTVKSES